MCVLKPDLVNEVVSNNSFYHDYLRYIILEIITKVTHLNSLKSQIQGKKDQNMQKHFFFVKKVCFETRFGQLSCIQQFISS